MNRQLLIDKTIRKIKMLPDSRIIEISDYADFLLSKIDDKILLEGAGKLVSESKAFEFLQEEEDLYNEKDLKIKYK